MKLTAQQIITAAHGIEWRDTESMARYVAEWAAEHMEFPGTPPCFHPKEHVTVVLAHQYRKEICQCGASREQYGRPTLETEGRMSPWRGSKR